MHSSERRSCSCRSRKTFYRNRISAAWGVDVGNGNPLSVGTKDASGNDAVQMRIPNQVVRECLDGGDHADADVVIIDGRGHELVDGFVAGLGGTRNSDSPRSSPWMVAMFGWLREARSRASRSNRPSRSGSLATASGSTLITTSRPSLESFAL